jgi:hypothetical protein
MISTDACVLVDLVKLHQDRRILVIEPFLHIQVAFVKLVEAD